MASWFYASEGKQQGPYPEGQFRDLIAQGIVRPDTLVWSEGMAGWQKAAEIPGLMAGAGGPPPMIPQPGGPPMTVLERVAVGFAGADAQRMVDRRDEDLAVADLPGTRVRGDDLDRLVGDVGGDRDFDAQLGQEVHDVFGAAIDFGMSLLAAVALDLGHRHAVDADGRQCLAHLVKLERFDDRDDEFHGQAFISLDIS